MSDSKQVDVLKTEDIDIDQVFIESDDPVAAYRSMSSTEVAAIEKALVRKLDTRILPVLVLIYILNYLDRNSITQARLFGLQKDAHVNGTMWNTAIAILSVGYVYTINVVDATGKGHRGSWYATPICMIVWAVVSGCTAFFTSTAGLLAVRLFLGAVEAPFFPCAIYYLSCWYKKSELGIRMAFLVPGLILSNAFSGLIAAGILSGMAGVGKLHSWQWLFILEGLATIVVATSAIFLLPDYPKDTRWLSAKESIVAQARLAIDIGSEDVLDEERAGLWQSLKQAGKDYRVWLFTCMQMATTAAISYSHYFPTLIKDLGFKSNTITLLLTSPPYILAFFWATSIAWFADRKQTRSPFAGAFAIFALIGCIVAVALPTDDKWPRYAMMFPLTLGTYGIYCTTYTWLSSTIVRPPPKRAAAIGIANTFANIASLFGNYFWLDKYEPDYTESWVCVIAFSALGLGCILALRFSLGRSNTRFDELARRHGAGEDIALSRLAEEDRRAVFNGFRYVI